MKIYLAIGGNKRVKQYATDHNLGWCMTPENNRNPTGLPYFLDNGRFHATLHDKPWDEVSFKRLIEKYPNADFIVAPDLPIIDPIDDPIERRKRAMESLRYSISYLGKIDAPLFLAVQDGMTMEDVKPYLESPSGFDGLFIGGSISWKFNTAQMWADLAHLYGKKCHAGRVGTWEGMDHMQRCNVDSIDSSTASRNCRFNNLEMFFSQKRLELWWG